MRPLESMTASTGNRISMKLISRFCTGSAPEGDLWAGSVSGRRDTAGAPPWRFRRPGQLEAGCPPRILEQALAGAEDHRADLKIDLVDQSAAMACRARGAPPAMEMSRSPAADCACVGGLDPVGDEVKVVPPPISIRVAGGASERTPGGDRAARRPTSPSGQVRPVATNRAEHVAAHDHRAHSVHHLSEATCRLTG